MLQLGAVQPRSASLLVWYKELVFHMWFRESICHCPSKILHLKALYKGEVSSAALHVLVSSLFQPDGLYPKPEAMTAHGLHWSQVLLLSFFIIHFVASLLKCCLNSSLLWEVLLYFCFNSSRAPLAGAVEQTWVPWWHLKWPQHPATPVGTCACPVCNASTITCMGAAVLLQYQCHVN